MMPLDAIFVGAAPTAGNGDGLASAGQNQTMATSSSSQSDHASFVTGVGGSLFELWQWSLVAPLALLMRNLLLPWLRVGEIPPPTPTRLYLICRFVFDMLLLVVPVLLSLTVLADRLSLLIGIQISVCASVLLLLWYECRAIRPYRDHSDGWQSVLHRALVEGDHMPTQFVSSARALLLVFTMIAILGVDFPVFPRRFAKTAQYGYSVMDLGTAAFVGIAGCLSVVVARRRRDRAAGHNDDSSTMKRLLLSPTVLLCAAGSVRSVLLPIIGYPHVEEEYGRHCNFFFIFAFVSVLPHVVGLSCPLFWTAVMAVVQQYLLSAAGVQEWVMAPRLNDADASLVELNREGISQLLGYGSLFYCGAAVGHWTLQSGCRPFGWLNINRRIFLLAVLTMFAGLGSEYLFGPVSRRVANIPYILHTIAIMLFTFALHMAVQNVTFLLWAARVPQFSTGPTAWCGLRPDLMEQINSHAFITFLLMNLSTGMTNGVVRTHDSPDSTALLCLVLHSLLVCAVVAILNCTRPTKHHHHHYAVHYKM